MNQMNTIHKWLCCYYFNKNIIHLSERFINISVGHWQIYFSLLLFPWDLFVSNSSLFRFLTNRNIQIAFCFFFLTLQFLHSCDFTDCVVSLRNWLNSHSTIVRRLCVLGIYSKNFDQMMAIVLRYIWFQCKCVCVCVFVLVFNGKMAILNTIYDR